MTIAWPDGTRKKGVDPSDAISAFGANLADLVEQVQDATSEKASLQANADLTKAIGQLVAAQNKQSALLSKLIDNMGQTVVVQAPGVNVEPPEVTVDVAAPQITNPPAQTISVLPKRVVKNVERDPNGYITRVVEEWVY